MPQHLSIAALRLDFLRALRGNRSAAQMSKLLGFRSNQYSRWGSGKIVLRLSDLVKIAAATKRDFFAIAQDKLHLSPTCNSAPTMLRELTAGTSQQQLAKALGVSRPSVAKWVSGDRSISTDQFLAIILQGGLSISRFARAFAPEAEWTSLREFSGLEETEKTLHFEYPWLAAIIRCFETVEYEKLPAHNEAYIARRTGLSREEIAQGMKLLQDYQLITQNRPGGKFSVSSKTLHTFGPFAEEKKIRLYWMKRAQEFTASLQTKPERSMLGYRVFSYNPKVAEKIRAAYMDFYRELEAVTASEPMDVDRIAFLSVQIIDLEEAANSK